MINLLETIDFTRFIQILFMMFGICVHAHELSVRYSSDFREYNYIRHSYDLNGISNRSTSNIHTDFHTEIRNGQARGKNRRYFDEKTGNLGKNYPKPIVNLQETRKYASDILWNMKDETTVIEENFRILKKHIFSKFQKITIPYML